MKAECYEQGVRLMSGGDGRNYASQIAEYYTALGVCYVNTGAPDKAAEMFARSLAMIDRKQSDSTWRYQNVRQQLVNAVAKNSPNGLDDVVAYYEKNMRSNGEMPQMRIAFALGYRESNQQEKSLAQFEIAANLLPQDASLRQEVVNGYVGLKQYGKAEQACLAWAKFDTQNIDVYKKLGELYDEMNRPQDAMMAYASMAQARPREAEGHRAYAQALVAKRMRTQAVVEYVKACRYRPTEFAIASELAALYDTPDQGQKKTQLWKDGEAACRQAMKDLPDDPLPWLNLARFLIAQDRKAEARDLCEQITKRQWPRFASESSSQAREIMSKL
jgi:tetratricopeptide (TPR) repeat protein